MPPVGKAELSDGWRRELNVNPQGGKGQGMIAPGWNDYLRALGAREGARRASAGGRKIWQRWQRGQEDVRHGGMAMEACLQQRRCPQPATPQEILFPAIMICSSSRVATSFSYPGFLTQRINPVLALSERAFSFLLLSTNLSLTSHIFINPVLLNSSACWRF